MPEDSNGRFEWQLDDFDDQYSEVTTGANESAHRFLRTKEVRTRLYLYGTLRYDRL
jgi:hypothetical protein